MESFSVIIPTFNRERKLKKCLKSIFDQTTYPKEIIIIDDGNLNDKEFASAFPKSVNFIYHKKKKEERGSALSRNIGAKLSHSNFLFFFDDDIILKTKSFFHDALEYMEKNKDVKGAMFNCYEKGKSRYVNNFSCINFFQYLLGLRAKKFQHVAPSGSNDYLYGPKKKVEEIEWMPSTAFLMEKDIFQKYKFDAFYTGYSLGEDLDLSYQISRKYKLVFLKNIIFSTEDEDKKKYGYENLGFMEVYNKKYFFKNRIPKKLKNILSYPLLISGLILAALFRTIFFRDRKNLQKLKGRIKGLFTSINGKR